MQTATVNCLEKKKYPNTFHMKESVSVWHAVVEIFEEKFMKLLEAPNAKIITYPQTFWLEEQNRNNNKIKLNTKFYYI